MRKFVISSVNNNVIVRNKCNDAPRPCAIAFTLGCGMVDTFQLTLPNEASEA